MASEMPPLDYLLLPPLYSQDKKKMGKEKSVCVISSINNDNVFEEI